MPSLSAIGLRSNVGRSIIEVSITFVQGRLICLIVMIKQGNDFLAERNPPAMIFFSSTFANMGSASLEIRPAKFQ